MATFSERILGAAKLDVATYEEIEADPTATGEAATVVALSGLAGGIAVFDEAGWAGMVIGTLSSLFAWCVWAALTYLVGTKVLPGPRTSADLGQMLRTIGFSSAPGIAMALGALPGLGNLFALVVQVWMLAAMVVAVRTALDYETYGRAIAVCVVGFVAYLLALVLIATMAGVLAASISAVAGTST